jgi:hypothetical protein
MLCRRDLGLSRGINLRDFSDGMLATMFVAAGCDYCKLLMGIGVITARNVVKGAFHGCEAEGVYHCAPGEDVPAVRAMLDKLFRSCNKGARVRVLPLDDP